MKRVVNESAFEGVRQSVQGTGFRLTRLHTELGLANGQVVTLRGAAGCDLRIGVDGQDVLVLSPSVAALLMGEGTLVYGELIVRRVMARSDEAAALRIKSPWSMAFEMGELTEDDKHVFRVYRTDPQR